MNHPSFATDKQTDTLFFRKISKNRLDNLLRAGYFRAGNRMMFNNLLFLMEDVFPVLQLRLDLRRFAFRKSQKKLMRQHFKRFRVEFGALTFSEERDALYRQHSHRFDGVLYDNLYGYFQEDEYPGVFDTRECRVYDKETGRLVAISFFDLGNKSLASILAVYDESIKNTSLGYFTLLMEVQFGMMHGHSYFHPGYTLQNNDRFAYKLRLGEMQYYNPDSKRWGYRCPNYQPFGLEDTRKKTKALQEELEKYYPSIPARIYLCPLSVHFSWDAFTDMSYVTSPVVLQLTPSLVISRTLSGGWQLAVVTVEQDIEEEVVRESAYYVCDTYSWKVLLIEEKIYTHEDFNTFKKEVVKYIPEVLVRLLLNLV